MTQEKSIERKFVNDGGIGPYSGLFVLMLSASTIYTLAIGLILLAIVPSSSVQLHGLGLWLDRLSNLVYILSVCCLVLLYRLRKSGIVLKFILLSVTVVQSFVYTVFIEKRDLAFDLDWAHAIVSVAVGYLWYLAWKSQQKYTSKYSIYE